MEGENNPQPPPPSPPRASSARWKLLRRAFVSTSSSDPKDDSYEMAVKKISRKTTSGFNMIPCQVHMDGDADSIPRIKDAGRPKDAYAHYALPTDASPKLIMFQRIQNWVNLNDFKVSKKYNVDNTGLVCSWPSENVLAYFCLKHGDMFRCKRVLELGAGYGLAGLAIAAGTGASEVVISDGNPQAVDYIHRNIIANAQLFGDTKVESMLLHWSQEVDPNIMRPFDIIVASDCTFFKEFHESLAHTIKSLLKRSETSEAIFVNPRRGDSLEKFLHKLEDIGLHYEVVENYDDQVWKRHMQFDNGDDPSWLNYDKDHCYPLLMRVAF